MKARLGWSGAMMLAVCLAGALAVAQENKEQSPGCVPQMKNPERHENFMKQKERLLKRGWLGNEYVTKEGRNVMKAAALVNPEVAEALQEALDEPVRKQMRAFVELLLVARSRLGAE